jgi:hypothetical protein
MSKAALKKKDDDAIEIEQEKDNEEEAKQGCAAIEDGEYDIA